MTRSARLSNAASLGSALALAMLLLVCTMPGTSFDEFAASVGLPAVFGPEVFAEFADVSIKTVYGWHDRGLPHFAAGRRVRYRRDLALAWLEAQQLERPGRGR